MKVSVDHVTNSSSESFATVIKDTAAVIGLSIPYIAATLGDKGVAEDGKVPPADDWGYEPYESTDPNDPPGTIIQNNPDGTVTKTLQDGTVGTQHEDGTIYVTQPDGTTGVIEPDGHQKITLPDGTKIEQYTDGTSYAEYPDGTERTEYEDGTVKEKDPNGEIVQMNPDGTFEVTEPGERFTKVYKEDGELFKAKDPYGTDVSVDENGNLFGKFVDEDGTESNCSGNINEGYKVEDTDGNFIEVNENGNIDNASIEFENGYYEKHSDGREKCYVKDPKTGESLSLEYDPKKGINYEDSQGNFIRTNEKGQTEASIKKDGIEVEMHKDGRMSYKDDEIEMHNDGKGRVEVKDREGNYQIVKENEDGSIDFESGDATGVKVTAVKDTEGNYEFNSTDGSQLIITKDDFTIKDTEGNSNTYTKEDIDRMVASGELGPGGDLDD